MSLSVCLITKNEEAHLERCLASVSAVADEIIVVDTGSTDKTKDIARKFNAMIHDFMWNDDFSEARNFSLKQASKDWILVLDADEFIATKDIPKLKECLKKKDVVGFECLKKNYTNDASLENWMPNKGNNHETKDLYGFFVSKQIKLFQNNKDVQFSGIVHEQVKDSIENKQGKTENANFVIHNTSYAQPASDEKKKYYLELSKKKAEAESSAQAFFELGLAHKDVKEYQNALDALSRSIKIDSAYIPALIELGSLLKQNKQYEKALSFYKKAFDVDPKNTATLFGVGLCLFYLQRFDESIQFLEGAELCNPNNPKVLTSLGAVYEKTDNLDKAVSALEKSVQLDPTNPKPYLNLGIVLEKMDKYDEAVIAFQKAINLKHAKSDQIKQRLLEMGV